MEVFKTLAFFSDHDEGAPYLLDTIFHEGSWWLVGTWLQSNDSGARTPEWLVLLNALRFQEVEDGGHRFVLNHAIPKAVLRGEAQEGYVVARFPMPDDTRPPQTKNQ